MRKSLFLALVFSLLAVLPAYAAAEGKIGVFNSRAVAAKCEPLTAAQKKLEGQFANEKKTLESQSAALQKQAEELQSKTAALSPEAREDRRASFLRSKRDFEDRYQAFARKAEGAAMRLQQEFSQQLFKAAQELGSRKGYAILLDSNLGGPVYYDKSVDVTEEMITELNRVYKETKPAAGNR